MKVFSAFPTPIYINNIEYDNDLLNTVKTYDYESFHSKELSGRYTVSKNILEYEISLPYLYWDSCYIYSFVRLSGVILSL
jgi:hypothetical protein